jgi:hypothetical protein
MALYNIAAAAIEHVLGPLLRRSLLAFVIAALAIVASYHFTSAATLALEAQYGVLQTQLIVAAIYLALALIGCAILWALRSKSASASAPVLSGQREMQMAMLVEAVMLGYALARKGERAP